MKYYNTLIWLVWCLRVYSKWVQLGQLEVDLWSNRSDFTNLIYDKQKSCIWKYVFFVTSTISQSLLGQAMPNCRSSQPEVFLGKGVLKICSKFPGQQPCRSTISIKLLCNFIEITLRHGCSPVKKVCCIFSEHLFLRTSLSGCFCNWLDKFDASMPTW